MPSMNRQQRRYNKNPQRRKIPGVGAENLRGSRTPIVPTFDSVDISNAIFTFDQPIVLKGVPQWPRQGGVLPASVTINNTNTEITLNYGGITAVESVTVPFEDPAVRNVAGGYVQPGTYDAPE